MTNSQRWVFRNFVALEPGILGAGAMFSLTSDQPGVLWYTHCAMSTQWSSNAFGDFDPTVQLIYRTWMLNLAV